MENVTLNRAEARNSFKTAFFNHFKTGGSMLVQRHYVSKSVRSSYESAEQAWKWFARNHGIDNMILAYDITLQGMGYYDLMTVEDLRNINSEFFIGETGKTTIYIYFQA